VSHIRAPAGERRNPQDRGRVGSAQLGAGIPRLRFLLVGTGGSWMVARRVRLGLERDREGTLMEPEGRRGVVQPRGEVG
jgi:hypothetical protein